MADLILVVLAIGIGQVASRGLIVDPGLGWHLRTPDFIFEHGWPVADPFSGPSYGNHWLANQWLGDFPLWLGWKVAGLNGVVAVTLAGLLLVYRLLYGFLRADGVPWPAAAGWTLLAAMGSYYAWMARPNLITVLAVVILARALTLYHEARLTSRHLLWLVPLFAAWANSHGGFIVGLAMIALAGVVELAMSLAHPVAAERSAARTRLCVLTAVGIGCGLATLINPYGWQVYPWVFSLLGNPYFMNLNTEWLSPDFHKDGSFRFGLLMLAFPAVFAVSRHRPNLVLLALAVAWFYLALQGRRYVPIWVLVTTPLLARAALEIDWLNARFARMDLREFFQLRSGGWVGYAALLIGLAVWARFGTPVVFNPTAGPTSGLQYLLQHWQPGETIVHNPNYGGYLTWHGWPALRVWIDDRNEVHGEEWYKKYLGVEETQPGWESTLTAWNPQWIAVPPSRPLTYRLAERTAEWDEVYRDDHVVLFRRQPALGP
jgi:hypothetical protein